ncbi:universal stress protein [Kluyvera intermedia]|jgi:universal stress protein G|uniref:Universal stress protein n=1 Tax=Kluyvera intermedia TaxID=61648 RepID=A0A447MH38_KLUIN|nr:universal stress protein [Kluyvera intermedia]QGH30153.1 universal stress protein UspG [Kluyvera intermedia]QGH39135.1 universal stress protein UspG [Kluyvera intermedia]WGL58161.1 universal stress protein [Kluyvera intermedia]WQD27813.1 universal stress protein [Kluyvera intermedia]VDZ83307.1 Universal stress protein G [Kluyvera intermedia]
MYKKILMPVDVFEMDLSDKAIRHAVYLAGEKGEITLLNVLPNSNRSILRGFASDIKKFEEYMLRESSKKMDELQRLFDLPRERMCNEVRFGNIRDEILAMSKSGDYDVIVIGSRQRGMSTHLLGSNAESILRYANIPTMVVR